MNEKLILGYSNWVEPEYMKKNQEIVDKFNEKWKEPDTFITLDDGEILSYNINWILDSEYMNFVYDNSASSRIHDFIKNGYIHKI